MPKKIVGSNSATGDSRSFSSVFDFTASISKQQRRKMHFPIFCSIDALMQCRTNSHHACKYCMMSIASPLGSWDNYHRPDTLVCWVSGVNVCSAGTWRPIRPVFQLGLSLFPRLNGCTCSAISQATNCWCSHSATGHVDGVWHGASSRLHFDQRILSRPRDISPSSACKKAKVCLCKCMAGSLSSSAFSNQQCPASRHARPSVQDGPLFRPLVATVSLGAPCLLRCACVCVYVCMCVCVCASRPRSQLRQNISVVCWPQVLPARGLGRGEWPAQGGLQPCAATQEPGGVCGASIHALPARHRRVGVCVCVCVRATQLGWERGWR